jgi:uncharacterized protein YnzC (UPF0291/DUF896 family)
VEATHVKKHSEERDYMKRDFLKGLGIEGKEVIDKIMDESGKDIEREKAKAMQGERSESQSLRR